MGVSVSATRTISPSLMSGVVKLRELLPKALIPVSSFDKLEQVLLYLDSEGKETILLGDTNCNLTAEQAGQPINNDTRHLICLYGLFSLNQLVWEPTRVNVSSSFIIDHIATNCSNNIIKSGVHKISLSDRFMVYCICKRNGAIEKVIN